MSKIYYNDRNHDVYKRTENILSQLPEFCAEFFLGIQSRTSALTRLNYAYDIRIFFDFLSKKVFKKPAEQIVLDDLSRLTSFDIEYFVNYLTSYTFNGKNYQCGERAKERKLCSVRSFFNYYFKKDLLESNVAAKVDLPKIHSKPIIRLEQNEIAKLLDSVECDDVNGLSQRENAYHSITKKRDFAILMLFLGTGIRISELVGLDVKDIDFKTNSFRVVRKGGNEDILYFTDEVADAIKDYLGWLNEEKNEKTKFGLKCVKSNDPALFLSLQGKRISVRAVENLVNKYCRIISPLKKITPHKLRSTFGTELYRSTKDIYVVADALGHKDVNTTKKHYADISDEIRRNAVKSIKLRKNDEN